jgi:hypothetical protein
LIEVVLAGTGHIVNVGFGATLLVLFLRTTVLFLRTAGPFLRNAVVLRKAIFIGFGIIVFVGLIIVPRPSNRARGDGGSTGSKQGCCSLSSTSPSGLVVVRMVPRTAKAMVPVSSKINKVGG